jgi:multidrug efflux system membrane fusion protein
MSGKWWFWTIVLLAGGASGYAVYAPDQADKVWPQAGAWARQARVALKLPADAGPKTAASAPASAPPPTPVEAMAVPRKDFAVVLESLGQVVPYNTVTVRARVDGQVMKIGFTEGQMVKQGDLLAEIDPRPLQATLDQAKAKKQADEATLANAKLDQARYATLAKQSYATQQQVDTQNSSVSQQTGQIGADTAAVEAATVQLGYTTITAPLSGRVGFRLIDQGNLVAASQQTGIVVINQLQPISATFTAPQERVGEINGLLKAGSVPIKVRSTDGKDLANGTLDVVDNTIDVATGTVKLKARFANTDNALWPGLSVIVDIALGTDKDVPVLPTAMIQHGQKGLFVYVIGDDMTVQLRPVKVLHQNVQETAIAEGLQGGEKIVTNGQALLRPGAKVSIQTAENRS